MLLYYSYFEFLKKSSGILITYIKNIDYTGLAGTCTCGIVIVIDLKLTYRLPDHISFLSSKLAEKQFFVVITVTLSK